MSAVQKHAESTRVWDSLTVDVKFKDLYPIEHIQRRATKYILNDYTSDYRSRLIMLNLLPMSMLSSMIYYVSLWDLYNSVSHPTTRSVSPDSPHSARTTHGQVPTRTLSSHTSHTIETNIFTSTLPPIDLSLSLYYTSVSSQLGGALPKECRARARV